MSKVKSYANTDARGGHSPKHQARHDKILTHLNENDHLTQRAGGEPTHGASTNFKVRESTEREKSPHASDVKEPIGGTRASNYGPPAAKGAHGAMEGKKVPR